jgi:hypothetical protein
VVGGGAGVAVGAVGAGGDVIRERQDDTGPGRKRPKTN